MSRKYKTFLEGKRREKMYLLYHIEIIINHFFFFQAEDGIRDVAVTGVQTCALPIYRVTWKPNEAGFLFVTRNGRPPSSNKVVEYHLWTILDALGIPRCGLHAFRHAHTSLLLDSGATPKVVQRQLRHSDARTTLEICRHVVCDAHREAVEKVASVLDAIGRPPTTVN